jgi:hypothetical protein
MPGAWPSPAPKAGEPLDPFGVSIPKEVRDLFLRRRDPELPYCRHLAGVVTRFANRGRLADRARVCAMVATATSLEVSLFAKELPDGDQFGGYSDDELMALASTVLGGDVLSRNR